MRRLWRCALFAAVATISGAPLAGQVAVEPEVGILFGENLGRAEWYNGDDGTTNQAELARKAALLIGFRVEYPLSSRISALGSYGSADIAYRVAVQSPVNDQTLDLGWRLNILSAQARVRLTGTESPVLAALSAGGARIGIGDGPFAFDGWWGGVLGATAGLRISPVATLTATQELYFYETDPGSDVLQRRHPIREHTLRLGISLTPWR